MHKPKCIWLFHVLCHNSISYAFVCFLFFFFNDTATTEIYTLSLHDALPISSGILTLQGGSPFTVAVSGQVLNNGLRSVEDKSELQSHSDLVCRLLLVKKKDKPTSASLTSYHLDEPFMSEFGYIYLRPCSI